MFRYYVRSKCKQYGFRIFPDRPSPLIIKYKIKHTTKAPGVVCEACDFEYVHKNYERFKNDFTEEDWQRILRKIFDIM